MASCAGARRPLDEAQRSAERPWRTGDRPGASRSPPAQPNVATRADARAADGLAEAYLALAAALRTQDASDSPPFWSGSRSTCGRTSTAARLLAADILAQSKRPDASAR